MTTITFISGMERFNAHVWQAVQHQLRTDGVDAQIRKFHDGHVDQHDPALIAAIEQADVLFISLINMREQATWLAAQIANSPARTIFAFESMPEVMALTRVGDYRVSGGKGALPKPMQALLKLITRGRDEDTLYAYTKLTKLTAKLLPLMPAKLKDFRTWLSVNIYWNQPDVANLTQMVRLILRDCAGQQLNVAAPRMIPNMGCFHPDSPELFENPEALLAWRRKTEDRGRKTKAQQALTSAHRPPSTVNAPRVALLAFRKHVVQGQAYLGELVHTLEAQGLSVVPIFVSGIEAHVAVREWVSRLGVDLLISTMGFPLVGGPAGSTNPGKYRAKASDMLATLDVPYMVAQPLQMQDEANWHERGVAPMQAVIMYDLPEMDGSIAPVALGAIRGQQIVASPDRLARVARQAAAWVKLRRTANHAKRVAFVLYNFPPGLGKLGTAALLDVPASLHATLLRLEAAGYNLGALPASPEALAQQFAALATPGDAPAQQIGLAEYRRITPDHDLERAERCWGAAPGEIAPAGRDAMRIDGFTLGNVFVGVQPAMGVPGDPMRLLFDKSFTPHHQYLAFYRWLSQVWQADAIVHVGMHGTAEWMPGLQLGLTGECWPDTLLGELPNFYLYPLNNPAEGAIARRRGYATLISHLVPPYARAGLYKHLATLRAEIADCRLQIAESQNSQLTTQTAELRTPQLPDLPPHADEPPEAYLLRLEAYLDQLEQRLISDGLHTFGQAPAPERAAALIEAALDVPRDGVPGLSQVLAAAGVAPADLPAARVAFVRDYVIADRRLQIADWLPTLKSALQAGDIANLQSTICNLQSAGRAMLAGLQAAGGELDALVHALDGGYIRPAPGGDPLRAGAAALPSGRNIHSIDPWRLPSDAALARGQQMATALLARHQAANAGQLPETVALTLWALDTIKTEGESLATALALVGARPERDGQGKIWRFELIPLAELGRPRVDLLLDISAIFRDTFQLSLDLLDDLLRRAATADEPAAQNPIRQHALALKAQGQSWEAATARIFTQAPGQYGTGVDELIDEGQWEANDDLAEMYLRRGSHSYGGGRAGTAAPEVLRGLLGTVGHVFQPIDSVEYGLTDMQHYYGHSGAIRLAAGRAQGGAVALTYAESYTGHIRLAGADELLRVEARTKLLNPKWYEGLLAHGYAGAAEIGNRFTYLLGWSATTGEVDPWVYQGMAETFVLDEAMRERLSQANPQAARNAVARLLEANGRGLWPSDEATLEQLQTIYADLEDRLEGAVVG